MTHRQTIQQQFTVNTPETTEKKHRNIGEADYGTALRHLNP